MHDKNEGMYRGVRREDSCDHVLLSKSCRGYHLLRVELDNKNDDKKETYNQCERSIRSTIRRWPGTTPVNSAKYLVVVVLRRLLHGTYPAGIQNNTN